MQEIQVPQTLFLIFTIAVVVSVIIQGLVFYGLYKAIKGGVNKIHGSITDISIKAVPVLIQTRTIVEDISPKLKVISANLAEISVTLRDQTKHVNSTVGDVVDKTRHQAQRVDEMVSAVLDSVTHAGATIQAGVAKPARQVNGVFQGIRAGLDTLFSKGSVPRQRTAPPVSTYPVGAAPEDYREPVIPGSHASTPVVTETPVPVP